MLPATAAADPVQRHAMTQSAAATSSYWTSARMRAATPVERILSASGKAVPKPLTGPQAPAPWSSAEVLTPYTDQPTSTHGKVFFTLGGTDYVCSGTALLSANKSVVWTAGHCVNQGPGAYATKWAFVPAYKDGVAPFGVFAAAQLMTTSQWKSSGAFGYDEGAAVVGTANGKTLTDAVGGRGIAFNYDRSESYQSHGYPAGPPFNGERHWVCDSSLKVSDTSNSPPTMAIGCDMTGGSSGGGWIVGSDLYSVNSYAYGNQPNTMYGPYMDSVAQSLYTAASSA
jgi:V8-like Glu-specific endopeptidase